MNNFIITSRDVLEQIRENGTARISYKINGFWSSEQITIYIDKRWSKDWNFTFSNASGGREDGFDEVTAMKNYGEAMISAADTMTYWKENVSLLEAEYSVYDLNLKERIVKEREIAEKRRAELKAEQEAKEAVDKPFVMGLEGATEFVKNLPNQDRVSTWFRRAGEELNQYSRGIEVYFETTRAGHKAFYFNGKRCSQRDLINCLKNAVMISQDLPWGYFKAA